MGRQNAAEALAMAGDSGSDALVDRPAAKIGQKLAGQYKHT